MKRTYEGEWRWGKVLAVKMSISVKKLIYR